MDKVFISLPKKGGRAYPNGGTEKIWMTEIARKLKARLSEQNIEVVWPEEEQPLPAMLRQCNEREYDLHLALRSGSAPEEEGRRKGARILYYSRSKKGEAFARKLVMHYREVYPEPQRVDCRAVTGLDELSKTKATALLIETAYHDNPQDEIWLTSHTEEIAEAIAAGVADIFKAEKTHA